jgi:4-aminobutyrate aminotransferase-like enzyme
MMTPHPLDGSAGVALRPSEGSANRIDNEAGLPGSSADLGVTMPIEHPGEPESNDLRRRLADVEPRGLRTFTPSLAVLSRAAGSYVYTPEGRRLADFTSGVLVANLGHNPPRWWRRVLDYMGLANLAASGGQPTAAPLTAYNAATPLEVEACERLLALMRRERGGARLEQVMWSASGSEGVIKAIRTALAQDPRRQTILATRYGFHGKKGLAGAVTGSERDPDRDERVRFLSFPQDQCASLERRRQPLDLAPFEAELAALDRELGDSICCLVTEPYLGGGGSYHPQPEYLQLLERFCRERDVVFILDEVQSNFGRTGELFAYTAYGLEPDLVVLGKGLGNGIPVDCVVGRADLFARLGYGEASDTWSGHPLGCAAVLATIDEFESGDVMAAARQLAATLEQGLSRLTALPHVRAIRGEGTVWGVHCAPVGERASADVAREIVRACYQGDAAGRAVHLLGPLAGDVIRVAPPLVMPPAEARESLDAMYACIESLAR